MTAARRDAVPRRTVGKPGESLRQQEFYPWVDVLRAMAVLMVFFNHFGNRFNLWNYSWLSRGGVSLFFVISGWLISLVIFRTIERPDFLAYFYSRRALRIFPVYFLTIGLYAAYAHLFRKSTFYGALPAFLSFNYSFLPYGSDLFEHAWSLAVEERFYLIWPGVCLFCRRFKIPVVAVLGLLVIFSASSLLPIPQWEDPTWAPLLPASIVYGCLLALVGSRRPPPRGAWGLGVAAVSMAVFLALGHLLGSMYHPIASLFIVPVVWCAGVHTTSFPKLLIPVAKLGELSYEIYLIHIFPMYAVRALLRSVSSPLRGALWVPVLCCTLALTILLALMINRFIERPVLGLRYRLQGRPRSARALAFLQVSLIPAGILFWLITGHPGAR